MKTMITRLKFAVADRERVWGRHIQKKELAAAAGVSSPAVTNWWKNETTELEAKCVFGLSKFLNINAEWLQSGKGSMTNPPANHNSASNELLEKRPKSGMFAGPSYESDGSLGKNDTAPGPTIRGKVPLISWDQVRAWDLLMQTFDVENAEGMLDCPVPHSKYAFCVKNNTDAMDDGTAEGYRNGEILFVDPESPAAPGEDVIAITPTGHVMFRRLMQDMEGPYLLSLNGKRIERLPEETIFRGVVIFSGVFRSGRSGN